MFQRVLPLEEIAASLNLSRVDVGKITNFIFLNYFLSNIFPEAQFGMSIA